MSRGGYIPDIEGFLEKKNPVDLLNAIFSFLNFKLVNIKIYNLLLKTSYEYKTDWGIIECIRANYLRNTLKG
ncbi:hypothetical protein DRN50_04050 [Thermococci archaeon]|nr:MAG: hypothetical protein DRN50_04050 [Thermococci archaeon]